MNDNDDDNVFAKAMAGVTPLKESLRRKHVAAEQRPVGKQRKAQRASEKLTPAEIDHQDNVESNDTMSYSRSGVQPRILRDLRRGKSPVDEEIDLHGMSSLEAHRYVDSFISHAIRQRYRVVRVVHGKGKHSSAGPILKRKVGGWLRARADVLAYESAQQSAGGTGALYVLLSR